MVAVAILAGGRAKRLGGRLKMHVEVGGRRIIDRQLDVLRPLFEDIVIISNDPAPFADFGLPVLPDEIQGEGPLRGIASALVWSPRPRVFVVAGDMPFLNADAIRHLIAKSGQVVVPVLGGHAEPLHAVYQRNCLAIVRRRLGSGQRKAAELLDHVDAVRVDANELREFDPELRCLTNVNTLADLQNADAWVSS